LRGNKGKEKGPVEQVEAEPEKVVKRGRKSFVENAKNQKNAVDFAWGTTATLQEYNIEKTEKKKKKKKRQSPLCQWGPTFPRRHKKGTF